jgi:hypothetical protein
MAARMLTGVIMFDVWDIAMALMSAVQNKSRRQNGQYPKSRFLHVVLLYKEYRQQHPIPFRIH